MYSELERLAYIKGDTSLADLYDRLGELQELEDSEDDRLASEYKRGFEDGRYQDDKDALEAANSQIEVLKAANKAIYDEFNQFLYWLKSDEAKLATNRKKRIAHYERTLYSLRRF